MRQFHRRAGTDQDADTLSFAEFTSTMHKLGVDSPELISVREHLIIALSHTAHKAEQAQTHRQPHTRRHTFLRSMQTATAH